ncbi:DUF4870 domain-containing protein [Vampirovibrio chlorellavorus]|uniref:DUF4870 domain-containing protein n=1 Tax=Vampirovibrio chlorellavorus TaxID=758823 RepID=UPI0026EBEC5D|nr:DUF4870 domain-containing protein [Vampirovibrio chlorellavorus]
MVNPVSSEPNSDDKLWAGLSYAGLGLFMIPTIVILLMKKGESAYIKFHCLQAIFFGLIDFIIFTLLGIFAMIPLVNILAGLACFFIGLGLLGAWVYLMIMAFTGKDFKIPVLGDFIDNNLMR